MNLQNNVRADGGSEDGRQRDGALDVAVDTTHVHSRTSSHSDVLR